jgi:hypothetical protein
MRRRAAMTYDFAIVGGGSAGCARQPAQRAPLDARGRPRGGPSMMIPEKAADLVLGTTPEPPSTASFHRHVRAAA